MQRSAADDDSPADTCLSYVVANQRGWECSCLVDRTAETLEIGQPVKDVLMRIQTWMTAVASALMWFAAQSDSSGQTPNVGPPPQGVVALPTTAPGGGMVVPPPYSNQNPGVIFPAGVPGNFQPWPGISPYHSANIAQTQHVNKGGLWFKESLQRKRTYYGSVEAMAVWFRDAGNATVGSPFAELAGFNVGLPLGEPLDFIQGAFPDIPNFAPPVNGFFSVDTRVLPFPALAATAPTFTEGITFRKYPIRNANDMGNPDDGPGLQARWGFEDEDGTGLMMNGWWAFEVDNSLQLGQDVINGVPVTQALTTQLGGQNLSTQYGHIPLDNGEPGLSGPHFGTGGTQKYDILYRLESRTEAGGANFSIYSQPLYRSSGFRVRPLWGMRYLYVNEGFRFRGVDSGFTYDVDNVGGGAAGGAGGAGAAGGSARADQTTIAIVHDQFEANLASAVESHIAGPEVGLRFDLGGSDGEGFNIWGETIFGLAANYDEQRLNGNNIGEVLSDARFINIDPAIQPRMLQPGVNTNFDERDSGTHVSPLFQQSVFVDFDLFSHLPLTSRMSQLENTNFRLGYTFLWVGQLSRPADSIRWQGFPLFPELKTNRKSWYMQSLSAAIDWRY